MVNFLLGLPLELQLMLFYKIFTDRYSLNINCGDKEVTINGTKYETDVEPKGASLLYQSPGSNWAFSSTGNFMDNNINDDSYIATSASKLTVPNSELYAKARLSPLSLTYYGLCMHNGSYTVKLHFAEIVFTNDSTYCSLGKRRFNVFIQVQSENGLFSSYKILCLNWHPSNEFSNFREEWF